MMAFPKLNLNPNGTMSTSCGNNRRRAKQRRHRHSRTEWESRREGIIQLYVGEDMTADEVLQTLKSDFGFSTGRRQLHKKLVEWGVRKNSRLNHEGTSMSLSDGQDNAVQAVSLTPPVQSSGTQTRQPTPLASQLVAAQFLPSAFVQLDGSPVRDLSQPDFGAKQFGASGNLSDNVVVPLRRVGRSNLSNHPLATGSGEEPAGPGSFYLPPAESSTRASLSREITLTPASNPSELYSETVLCLEQSLYQVLDLMPGQPGHINHSNALQLKKSVETLLSLSQKVAEESESDISGFHCHRRDSFGECLNMTKSLIALSPIVTLNTYTSVGVPHQILPSPVVWKRTRKEVRVGTMTLTVTEKTPRKFAARIGRDNEAQMTDWHFGARLVFRPEKLNNILQIHVQRYQAAFCNISLPPKIVVSNIIPNDSPIFEIAKKGSVEKLHRWFVTGKASLRDCNENGASLLYYACSGWNTEVCEYLIRNGVDVDEVVLIDSSGGETTPLHLSLGQDNLEISEALLTAGADPTMEFNLGGCRASILDVLADNMESPSRKPSDYQIVPHLLNLASHFGVSSYRLKGYRPLLYNLCNAGNMPTWLPIGPEKWVTIFLDAGCRTDDRCSFGTCLHMFFRSLIQRPSEIAWQKALITLVQRGADVYSKDDWGITVSDIAYAKLACYELNNYDLGSYRGDLWDSVLHACNYNIADFRKNRPRIARYTCHYTREDFEKLWEANESSRPYWDDGILQTSLWGPNFETTYSTNEEVLCTCTDEGPTYWIRTDDKNTNCRNMRDYQSPSRYIEVDWVTL